MSDGTRSRRARVAAGLLALAVATWIAGCATTPQVLPRPAAQPVASATLTASATAAASVEPSSQPDQVASQATSEAIDPTQLDPRVTQATIGSTIGISGWSAQVRPPESVTGRIKRALMRQHHYDEPLSAYELDHFIPLGVGGSSNLSNLWLEPIAEARLKDRDETMVHRKVTEGEWTLAQGQQYIRERWRIHYAQ